MRYLIGGIAVLIGMSGCGDTDKTKEAKAGRDTVQVAPTKNEIVGVGRIEPEDGVIELTAGATGRILEILVKDNQTVEKGMPLLRIDIALENAQVQQAQSKLSTQQAAVSVNQSTLEGLRVNLENARETYQRNLDLYKGNAQTKQVLDDSKASVDKLTKDVETAEASIRQSQSRMGELQADLRYYRTVVNNKRVEALMAGKILKMTVKTGDYINNDTKIAEFAPSGGLYAKTEVDELYAERVNVGQKAYIVSQTTGDTLATGMVSFAADYLKQKSLFKDQATEQEDRRVREVFIRLDTGKMPLIGSRVDCVILLK
ncbi:HlyD family secretion protein [Runella slithyformis]|uniref:Biotin/lipoyl attachment domain-containing protein n=1 Tax=Runella slithyformis (strain ATCC 29530 / DSM 19594 / LMG 11500 / NCIMB 11436 / LSU 4) TaxID=761193 RepID=A0A7U4E8L9_RUNSL|nr:biotin/lipoyl-binding protein [Runella slithyformis]AEI51579.1 biotin/lipoyl attachment domain-containing protein [Runella slithyformis DSM 19594]